MRFFGWFRRSKVKPAELDSLHMMLMEQATARLIRIRELEKDSANALAAWKANNLYHAGRIEELEAELEMRRDMLGDASCQLEMIRTLLGVSVEPHQCLNERMVVAAGDAAKEAALWRGLIGCARMTWMGAAGFSSPEPNGFLHLTVNLWNIHEEPGDGVARELLTTFAKDCAARKQLESTRPEGETTSRDDRPASGSGQLSQ